MKEELPEFAEVVVIGGGVVGLSTLYHLSDKVDAILLERDKLTSGTTWHSAANVRSLRANRNLTKIINYGIELYQNLERETGQSVGWINAGSISLATVEERQEDLRRQQALSMLYGIETIEIDRDEMQERWPLLYTGDVLSAMWSPRDGRVSPSDLSAAYARGAKAKGAKIFEHCPVEDIVIKAGSVTAVLVGGHTIRTDKVLICAGLWSREIGKKLNIDIQLYACEHFYLLTKAIEGIKGNLPTLIDNDHGLYIRDDSGGLLVGSFEERGKSISLDKLGDNFAFGLLDEDWDHFEPLMIAAMNRIPSLAQAEVKTLLNGPESFTTDNQFLLGEHSDIEGLILGCGMNSVGVASSGGIGMLLSNLVVEGRMPMDMLESDPSRLYAGLNEDALIASRVEEVLGRRFAIPYPDYQWKTARRVRYSPFFSLYVQQKPHLTQSYGWERALYFNKEQEPTLTFARPSWFYHVKEEVLRVNQHGGLFDLSMYGKILIEGEDALAFLELVCTNDIDVATNRVVYTAMLDRQGGFVSDVTVLRLGKKKFRMITGAVTVRRDFARLSRIAKNFNVVIHDETTKYALLGLMGKVSDEVLGKIGLAHLSDLRYFHHEEGYIANCHVRVARLSYVGERGVEITMRTEHAEKIASVLLNQGIGFVGFYAQESMRLEKGYIGFGHDVDADDNPYTAGLDFIVSNTKDFIGSQALQHCEKTRRLVLLQFEDDQATPWGHEPVFCDNTIVGETRSACYGYRVGYPIAMAMLFENYKKPSNGDRLEVKIGATLYAVMVKIGSCYDPQSQVVRRQ